MRAVNVYKLRNNQENDCVKIKKIKYYDPVINVLECDLEDEKSKKKFVDLIEKIIRKSPEYREFISFLKDFLDMKYCSYFNKINKDIKGISIEIHHTPFTLYDLVYIVMSKYIENGIELNPFYIANEVMKLHYEGKVGLYPLSETVHELVHSGQIYIPVKFVAGDIVEFYKEYNIYMSDDQKLLLAKHIELSEEMENIPDVLKKKYIYLDIDDESGIDEINVPEI